MYRISHLNLREHTSTSFGCTLAFLKLIIFSNSTSRLVEAVEVSETVSIWNEICKLDYWAVIFYLWSHAYHIHRVPKNSTIWEPNDWNKQCQQKDWFHCFRGFSFTSFLRLVKDHQMVRLLIRLWRESPQIRRWCYNNADEIAICEWHTVSDLFLL